MVGVAQPRSDGLARWTEYDSAEPEEYLSGTGRCSASD
jgi:hypothetical protein